MKSENLAIISIAIMAFIAIFALPILAQNSASFKSIYFLGKGVAVNPSNSQDISVVKIGAAELTVNIQGTSTDVNLGILYFGDTKYVLKDINAGNGTNSGNVYLNNSVVGNYNLNLISKPSDNIWAGTITLSGTTYNAYILEAQRGFVGNEEQNAVAVYCQSHTDDSNCRNGTENFCASNPTDQRCVGLLNNYCKDHLMDGRCRQELGDFCKTHLQNNPTCQGFCQRYPETCGTTATTTTTSLTTTSSSASTTSTSMSQTTTAAATTTTSTTTSVASSTTTSTTASSSTTTAATTTTTA